MPSDLPQTMRAVVLEREHEELSEAIRSLHVVRRPVPQPGRGQVLVRIEAAPCNPSDLVALQGKYIVRKSLPTTPGWEGAGQVVAHGGGLLGRLLQGNRVACALEGDRDGTWAEYFVAEATQCVPLRRGVSYRQAAGLIVNPLTALGLLDVARRGGHRAAVMNAAASQLGRMLLRIGRDRNYPLICVVRREGQVELLRELGAEHVLNSSDDNFRDELSEVSARLSATIAWDAVAGEMTGILLDCLPAGSHICVYGALSDASCGEIPPRDLIVGRKSIGGFYLPNWLHGRNLLSRLAATRRVQRMILDGLIETKVQRRVALEEAAAGILHYCEHMTDGKIHLAPRKEPGGEEE